MLVLTIWIRLLASIYKSPLHQRLNVRLINIYNPRNSATISARYLLLSHKGLTMKISTFTQMARMIRSNFRGMVPQSWVQPGFSYPPPALQIHWNSNVLLPIGLLLQELNFSPY